MAMQDFCGQFEKETKAQITKKTLPIQLEFGWRRFFQTIHFLLSCQCGNNFDAMQILSLMLRP